MAPILGIWASSQTANVTAPASFESIATVAGTGSSATVTFSSIPSGYKSLQIRYIGKSTTTGSAAVYTPTMTFNGSAATYASHGMRGNGSAVIASGAATQSNMSFTFEVIPNSSSTLTSIHGVGVIDIIDYTSTTKAKTVRGIAGQNYNVSVGGLINLFSGLWYATPAAITSIAITVPTGSWTTTSSFALYGVK